MKATRLNGLKPNVNNYKQMKQFYSVILFLLFAIPATFSNGNYMLPQPKSVSWGTGKPFHLSSSVLDRSSLKINMVDQIPEAVVNQNEAYRLSVSDKEIIVDAVTESGVYWAMQTLEQLIAKDDNGNDIIPACDIVDYPAFRVRGFMHDVGRSFISVEEIKKHIALLSKFKINVFHWHLTENQGWRLESKRYPELNADSSFERLVGKYYTIEDAKEITEWCAKHNMLLIPEIDMPGHSAAFVRATGVDMQSERGTEIIKDLMDEICTEVFPDVPYIHIGTDEVQFTNPNFVPEMVEFIRSKGKKVISWNPGWNYKVGEIDMTQLWSYRGKAQPGIPAVDSKFHYTNHFDYFGDLFSLYNSKIYNTEIGSDDIAGAIIAIWNDRLLINEKEIVNQNSFYPTMLALADRAWKGGGTEYFDDKGVMIPTDANDPVFKSFADFEDRMLWFKDKTFNEEPFPYWRQTNVNWLITDAFPNDGDLNKSFAPERSIKKEYKYNGKTYNTSKATGAGIYLRHVWGTLVPGFYKEPEANHTSYAYTWVYSPKKQEVGAIIEFQNYSRSEADLAPPQGKWDYKESKVWINNKEIAPPTWLNTHTTKTNEISLKNENAVAREPIKVNLKKGWNKVLLKLPVAGFSSKEIRLEKWMFTFLFVTPDGRDAAPGLIYRPEKKR